MTAVFLKIAGMSLTACVVIAAVILLRFLLKKAPKVFSYALWTVVFFRLLCPFTLELPSAVVTPVEIETVDMTHYEYNAPSVPDIGESRGGTVIIYTSESEEDPINKKIGSTIDILAFIWLCGTAAMLCYGIISYVKLKARLKNAVAAQGYFLCGNIDNPFIMGIFKPKIYLPEKLGEDETRFILMHENAHIRRGDHIAKIVMFCGLCLHWFNPLVWLSFKLCERDMEMSCDEGVTKNMSPENKADYGQTLLNITAKRMAAFTACFGENGTKQRVKNVLSYKKPALWIIIICAVLAIGAVAVLSVNQKKTEDDSVFGSINASAYGSLEIEIDGTKAYYFTKKDENSICSEFTNAIQNAEIKQHGTSVLTSTDKSVDFDFYDLDFFTVSSGENASGEEAFEISCVNIKIMDKKFFEISREDFELIYSAAERMVFYPERNEETFRWEDDSFICNKVGGAWENEEMKDYSAEYSEEILAALRSAEYRPIKTNSPLPVDPLGELRFYYGDGNAEQDYDYYNAIEPFEYIDENSRVINGISILSTNMYHYYEIPYDVYTKIVLAMYNAAFDLSDSDRYERLIDSDNWVIHKDGDIVSGSQVWSDFYSSVLNGTPSAVNIAFYYTLEGQGNVSEELYAEIKNDYPKLFKVTLEFDGNSFTLNDDDNVRSYRYLKRYDIIPKSQSAAYESCVRYVLVNDNNLTWDEIESGMLSSQSDARIDHYTVYTDYVYTENNPVSEKIPPDIKIGGVIVTPGACEITQIQSDGTAKGILADAPHPLDSAFKPALLTLADTKGITELECDFKPDRAVLTEWDITEIGNYEAEGVSNEIDSPQIIGIYADKIYQLRLYWDNSESYSGYADYVFTTGTSYPITPVSEEWSEQVYFGSEFPYIIYADEKICAFTEGVSGFFIYSFEEKKLVFTSEMKATLSNAGVEHGGLESWNGISLAPYNADGKLKFLCSAHTPDITRGFEIDLENNVIKEIPDFESKDIAIVSVTSEKLPDGVTDALSFNCVYLENGYIYIRNSGINNDILPGEGSHLPMIELMKVTGTDTESFIPFLE